MKRNLMLLVCVTLIAALGCTAAVRCAVPAVNVSRAAEKPILILDAGHGGEDGGACSASGHKESEINLAIVLRLESLLAFLGVDTVLTRTQDSSICDPGCETLREKKASDLKNRVSLVQSTPNAFLLSVHQNSFTDKRYKGAQVFYGAGDVSGQWGNHTQELFCTLLDPSNTRKAAAVPEHVYLFSHIDCPAILVECGFLSNEEDTSLLLTECYQRKIAIVLAGAYLHQLDMIQTPLGGD